jgi:hypothetical protein
MALLSLGEPFLWRESKIPNLIRDVRARVYYSGSLWPLLDKDGGLSQVNN